MGGALKIVNNWPQAVMHDGPERLSTKGKLGWDLLGDYAGVKPITHVLPDDVNMYEVPWANNKGSHMISWGPLEEQYRGGQWMIAPCTDGACVPAAIGDFAGVPFDTAMNWLADVDAKYMADFMSNGGGVNSDVYMPVLREKLGLGGYEQWSWNDDMEELVPGVKRSASMLKKHPDGLYSFNRPNMYGKNSAARHMHTFLNGKPILPLSWALKMGQEGKLGNPGAGFGQPGIVRRTVSKIYAPMKGEDPAVFEAKREDEKDALFRRTYGDDW